MDFEPIKIYCDMDALLDTRLATLYRLNPAGVDEVMAQGYLSRGYDEFPGYDIEAYHTAYKERDAVTLSLAMMTEVILFIKYFADTTLKAIVSTPLRRQPELILNMYPYVIPTATKAEIIKALRFHTEDRIDITLVSWTIDELTPTIVKKDFAAVVMYEYWLWLEHHAENKNLETLQPTTTKLIGPAIVRSSKIAASLAGLRVFESIEHATKPIINLSLYPISKFSVDLRQIAKHSQVTA